MNRNLNLIGYASGLGGPCIETGQGPLALFDSPLLKEAMSKGSPIVWDAIFKANPQAKPQDVAAIQDVLNQVAHKVVSLLKAGEHIVVVGGDHTSAIATWSGVHEAYKSKGDIGLIWIDAHMDSHTEKTSESGRVHGMPLACLLGEGFSPLTTILSHEPKIKPQNLCLIGVRSFEGGEERFLRKHQVKIFHMDEVKERGFQNVLKEAIQIVTKNTVGFGLSIDLDSLDPKYVPGIDVPEADGIKLKEMLLGIEAAAQDPRLLASEIVEFNPTKDIEEQTEGVIVNLLEIIAQGRIQNEK